jgi:hypothetical protein
MLITLFWVTGFRAYGSEHKHDLDGSGRSFTENKKNVEYPEIGLPIEFEVINVDNDKSIKVFDSNYPPMRFGMNIQFAKYRDSYDNMRKLSALAAEIGVDEGREEFTWEDIQPKENEVVTDQYDQQIEIMKDFKHSIFMAYHSPWSTKGVAPHTTKQYTDYANYAEKLIKRWGKYVNCWEIWNEPNSQGFWKPKPNAQDYTNLLKTTYLKMKESNPDAKVLGMSMVGFDYNFAEEVLKSEGGNYFDVFSIHPYLGPASPESVDLEHEFAKLRSLMQKYNAEKPIWANEVGWPTHKEGFLAEDVEEYVKTSHIKVHHNIYKNLKNDKKYKLKISEESQARWLVRTYVIFHSLGIKTYWYCLFDPGDNEKEFEDHLGIVRYNQDPKPAFYAYKKMTEMLRDKTLAKEYVVGNKIKMFSFKRNENEQSITLAWSYDEYYNEEGTLDENEKEIVLLIEGEIDTIFDIYGEEKTVSREGKTLSLTLSGQPTYIVGDYEINNWELK